MYDLNFDPINDQFSSSCFYRITAKSGLEVFFLKMVLIRVEESDDLANRLGEDKVTFSFRIFAA